jgi:hypothetical protein
MHAVSQKCRFRTWIVWIALSTSWVPNKFALSDFSMQIASIGKETYYEEDWGSDCVFLPLWHSTNIRYVWHPIILSKDDFTVFIIRVRDQIFNETTDSVFLFSLIFRLSICKIGWAIFAFHLIKYNQSIVCRLMTYRIITKVPHVFVTFGSFTIKFAADIRHIRISISIVVDIQSVSILYQKRNEHVWGKWIVEVWMNVKTTTRL